LIDDLRLEVLFDGHRGREGGGAVREGTVPQSLLSARAFRFKERCRERNNSWSS
jgi:hypothetical protein